ncbi:hypothetical protein J3D45_000777 [Microbacterium foliorum]|uniref:hypothetical protein n=1 Tax=Microbacterium foliorum TaxID=104336 RepID=UPI00209D0512|nr:hypothetical protein [Microbacterium foliorum]MCP1428279.1 hypothetical protein [Microbacterium foliorum]
MNDKNPTPDQTPENLPANTPPAPPAPPAPLAPPSADAETVPVAPIAAESAPQTPASAPAKPRRTRALLIGGGIAAAVVLVGGGVALGAAVGDEFGDDHDRPSVSDGPRGADDRGADDRGGRPGDDRDDAEQGAPAEGGPGTGGPAGEIGTDSADEIVAIADAARGAADGEVTSIDAKRDGTWEVQLTASDGSESEVRVTADLATTVVSTEQDDDDSAPTRTLDEATIRALVDAALTEAEGLITDLDADNDDVSPYDVSVLTGDRRSVDIDFSADFAVVGTDIDD